MTEDSTSDEKGGYEYFVLDSSYIDIEIVKSIGINQAFNSIVVGLSKNLVSSTIHLDAFSEKTIKPLKKDLAELLKESKNRQSIINSVVSCIIRNIDAIKASQAPRNRIEATEDVIGIFEGSSNAKILVDLASLKVNTERFFKDQYGRAYAAVRLGNNRHLVIMPLKSSKYKHYLAKLFRDHSKGEIIGEEAINNAINSLDADAEFDGETIPLHLRVAWGQKENGAKQDSIYYDMTDAEGCVLEISKDGWRMINGSDVDVPILFKRHNQIAQVEPDRDYPSDIFDQFLRLTNVTNPEHKHLLKVLIVSSFIPEIDHPILTTYGPQGAAKSFLLRLIKMLADPSKPVLLTLLKNIPEFIQQVNHNYLAFYDNVKYIPYWLSDEICKAVTGIGHTKRELYSDDNDIIYEHRRLISINGINVALTEPDALDRSIFTELPDIDDAARREKEELLSEFEKIRPKLLAYILDILVKTLQIKPNLKLTRLPRMADFAKWGEAISRAMGYDNFTFLEAYAENRSQQNVVAVNENIIGAVFVKFYRDYETKNKVNSTFVGSPELLYKAIIDFAEANQINVNYQQFPKAPNILVKKLKSLKSNLREGFDITIEIERDCFNNSIITIYGKKPTTTNVITLQNHYYGISVQKRHIQNYNFFLKPQAPYNNELTSETSEPPMILPNSISAGGMEATEATSLPSGEVDAGKKDEIIAASCNFSINNQTHISNNSSHDLYWRRIRQG